MILGNILLYIFAFGLIWIGSGIAVTAVDKLSHRLHKKSFMVSFIILGLLTSTSELFIGVNAVTEDSPSIFAGNLLGGIMVIFLLIIPLLAFLGNGVNFLRQMNKKRLVVELAVIGAPAVFIIDQRITVLEGYLFLALYLFGIYVISKRKSSEMPETAVVEEVQTPKPMSTKRKINLAKIFFRIMLGVVLIFIASTIIIDQTKYFAELLQLPLFLVSLFVVSLGSNMPELSIAVRAVIEKKKDIAAGDYMGSALTNTLLFGVLTILHGEEIVINTPTIYTSAYVLVALGLFFLFTITKNKLSRREAALMLCLFALFSLIEISVAF